MPCVVLLSLEALGCRVLIPAETWYGFTRDLPSGIRTPDLLHQGAVSH